MRARSRYISEHLFKNTEFEEFREKNSNFLIKKIDFFRKACYTVDAWYKMDVKWSKMEEVRYRDRKISRKNRR